METRLFQRFVALAYDKAGIAIRPGKEALVAARVARRQRALCIGDPESYLRFLEADTSGEELTRFLDVISTHFTSFMREPDHFDLLRAEVARMVASGQRRVRLWSAAASTGEEPWSMLMTALAVEGAEQLDLKLLATDIAVDTLKQAADGCYPPSRLDPVPAPMRDRWFERRKDPRSPEGEWLVARPALRERVVFGRLNLAEPPYPMRGPMDVVFCRNVFIYFDQPTRQRIVSAIEPLLGPGAIFCVGHTETLSGIRSGLKLQRPSVFRQARSAGA